MKLSEWNDKLENKISRSYRSVKFHWKACRLIKEGLGGRSVDAAKYVYGALLDAKDNVQSKEYVLLRRKLIESALSVIVKKRRIGVLFLVPLSSLWSHDRLYQKFEETGVCDVYVSVVGDTHFSKENMIRHMDLTKEFFKERKNIRLFDLCDKRKYQDEIDILVYLMPYESYFPEMINPRSVRTSKLLIFIPYSIMISGDDRGQNNLPYHNIFWKVYQATKTHQEMFVRNNDIKGIHSVYSGYPKMDDSYGYQCKNSDIWKEAVAGSKKIIYAPHHSIEDGDDQGSTFHLNYKYMFEYAKSHLEYSWIVRPHQNLKETSVRCGLFRDLEEYNAYFKKWDELVNARYMPYGEYYDVFATSDLMITDSQSFLSVYLYFGKPQIALTRTSMRMNQYGKELFSAIDAIDGRDTEKIFRKIDEILKEGIDMKMDERNAFFSSRLDYLKINGR